MKPILRAGQAAWLAEIGVDMHWLEVRPETQPAVAADAASTTGATAAAVTPAIAAAATDAPSSAEASAPPPVAEQSAALRARLGIRDPATLRSAQPAPAPTSETAPREALADLDLAALAARVLVCQQCARHQQRLRAVPGSGQTEQPYYLIVAEQPGIDDEIAGLPFQGDAGRLLDTMLAAVQLPQAESRYGTYVIKCRAVSGREPDADEVAACVPYLQREIELLQPQWILALGRVAARALLGAAVDFDAVRGTAQRYGGPDQTGIPVWVTHQPASLLVRGALKAEAWRDLVGLAQAVRAS